MILIRTCTLFEINTILWFILIENTISVTTEYYFITPSQPFQEDFTKVALHTSSNTMIYLDNLIGCTFYKKRHYHNKRWFILKNHNKHLTKTTESLCIPFFVKKNISKTVSKEFIFKNPCQTLYPQEITQQTDNVTTEETLPTKKRKFMKLLFHNRIQQPKNISKLLATETMNSHKNHDLKRQTTHQQNNHNLNEDHNINNTTMNISTNTKLTKKINKVNTIYKTLFGNKLVITTSRSDLSSFTNNTNERNMPQINTTFIPGKGDISSTKYFEKNRTTKSNFKKIFVKQLFKNKLKLLSTEDSKWPNKMSTSDVLQVNDIIQVNSNIMNTTMASSNNALEGLHKECVKSDFLPSGEIKESVFNMSVSNDINRPHQIEALNGNNSIIYETNNYHNEDRENLKVNASFLNHSNKGENGVDKNSFNTQVNLSSEYSSNEKFSSNLFWSSFKPTKKRNRPKKKWSHVQFKKLNLTKISNTFKHKSIKYTAKSNITRVVNVRNISSICKLKMSSDIINGSQSNCVKSDFLSFSHIKENFTSLPLNIDRKDILKCLNNQSKISQGNLQTVKEVDTDNALEYSSPRYFGFLKTIFNLNRSKDFHISDYDTTQLNLPSPTTCKVVTSKSLDKTEWHLLATTESFTFIPYTLPVSAKNGTTKMKNDCVNEQEDDNLTKSTCVEDSDNITEHHTISSSPTLTNERLFNFWNIFHRKRTKEFNRSKSLAVYNEKTTIPIQASSSLTTRVIETQILPTIFANKTTYNIIKTDMKKIENQATIETSPTSVAVNSTKTLKSSKMHNLKNILRFYKLNSSDKLTQVRQNILNLSLSEVTNQTAMEQLYTTVSSLQNYSYYTCSSLDSTIEVDQILSKTKNKISFNHNIKENKPTEISKTATKDITANQWIPLVTENLITRLMHPFLNKHLVNNKYTRIYFKPITKWRSRNKNMRLKYSNASKYESKFMVTSEANLFQWCECYKNYDLNSSISNYIYLPSSTSIKKDVTKNNEYLSTAYSTSKKRLMHYLKVFKTSTISSIIPKLKNCTTKYINKLSTLPFQYGNNSSSNLNVDKEETFATQNIQNLYKNNKFIRFLFGSNVSSFSIPDKKEQVNTIGINLEHSTSSSTIFNTNNSNKADMKYFSNYMKKMSNNTSTLPPDYADYFNPYAKKKKIHKFVKSNLLLKNDSSFHLVAYVMKPFDHLISVFRANSPNNITKLADVNASDINNGSLPAHLNSSNSSFVILTVNNTNSTSNETHEPPKIGFFDLLGGWFHCVMETYNEPKAEDIHFYLYTRNNSDTPEELFLPEEIQPTENVTEVPEPVLESSSTAEPLPSKRKRQSEDNNDFESLNPVKTDIQSKWFNVRTETKILIHGYVQDYQTDIMVDMKDAYLAKRALNVILVDWSVIGDNTCYPMVASKALRRVGSLLTRLLDELVTGGVSLDSVHLVGFSLGAHVAGHAGNELRHGLVGRISGLDPALPYVPMDPDVSLDSGDAVFVDIIHTAAGYLGQPGPMGHADFYPNGGSQQPGCDIASLGTCSHRRSALLFIESINSEKGFPATLCDSWHSFQEGHCNQSVTITMGDQCPTNSSGKYYLFTGIKEPFAQLPGKHIKVKKSLWLDLFYEL